MKLAWHQAQFDAAGFRGSLRNDSVTYGRNRDVRGTAFDHFQNRWQESTAATSAHRILRRHGQRVVVPRSRRRVPLGG